MQNDLTSGTTIKDSVQRLADDGKETIGVLKDRASMVADTLKQQYTSAVSRSVDFVQARPLAAIGIALGLGYMSRTILKLGMLAGAGLLLKEIVGPKIEARMNRGSSGLGSSSGLGGTTAGL